jgi:hypothetical protein
MIRAAEAPIAARGDHFWRKSVLIGAVRWDAPDRLGFAGDPTWSSARNVVRRTAASNSAPTPPGRAADAGAPRVGHARTWAWAVGGRDSSKVAMAGSADSSPPIHHRRARVEEKSPARAGEREAVADLGLACPAGARPGAVQDATGFEVTAATYRIKLFLPAERAEAGHPGDAHSAVRTYPPRRSDQLRCRLETSRAGDGDRDQPWRGPGYCGHLDRSDRGS